MAKTGRRFKFHGAFGTKSKAKKKESKVDGFIKRVKIRGQTRYVVVTRKG